MRAFAGPLQPLHPRPTPKIIPFMSAPASPSAGFTPVLTFVVWTVCAAVGGAGLALHYARPQSPPAQPEAVMAEAPVVELPKEDPKAHVPDEAPPTAQEPPKNEATPPEPTLAPSSAPAAPPPLAPPDAPAFTPVAAPSETIAFAVPVEGPTRVVARTDAAAARTTGSPHGTPGGTGSAAAANPGAAPSPPATPQAQTLVFGQGEGKQEKPDYPREALRRRQEGTVVVRLEVDEQGAVTEAQIAQPCAYPLLNQAAVSAVKKTWHFPAGAKRVYQVPIKFVLQ